MKPRQVILILIMELSILNLSVICVTIMSLFFLLQDQEEAVQEGDSTLQDLYLQTEMKNNRSTEASEAEEEDEDEGVGQGMPMSISK